MKELRPSSRGTTAKALGRRKAILNSLPREKGKSYGYSVPSSSLGKFTSLPKLPGMVNDLVSAYPSSSFRSSEIIKN